MAVDATPQEKLFIAETVGRARIELRNGALMLAEGAGFADMQMKGLVSILTLLGAAKLVAIECKCHAIFQAACQDMAAGTIAGDAVPPGLLRN